MQQGDISDDYGMRLLILFPYACVDVDWRISVVQLSLEQTLQALACCMVVGVCPKNSWCGSKPAQILYTATLSSRSSENTVRMSSLILASFSIVLHIIGNCDGVNE